MKKQYIMAISIAIVATLLCVAIVKTDLVDRVINKATEASATAQKKQNCKDFNSAVDGSVFEVESYIKKQLKDQSSFDSISWSHAIPSQGACVVECQYRAKNSFGGTSVERQRVYFTADGVVIWSDLIEPK